jgi:hypothetical protein
MFSDQLVSEQLNERCNVGLLLDSLDEKERVALNTILTTWSYERASAAIKAEGSVISSKLIGKHVKKTCSCSKDKK